MKRKINDHAVQSNEIGRRLFQKGKTFIHYFKQHFMENMGNQKMMDANNVFSKSFLNSKSLYLYRFNLLPNIHFISQVDGIKASAAFRKTFAHLITTENQYCWFD